MKLLKKLIPLGVVASVAAGVAPTLAACSTTDGWVDGTKAVDTSKFLKYDGELDFNDPQDAREALTEAYFTELKAHKNLTSDDYAYSLNQIDAVLEILPSFLATEGVLPKYVTRILSLIFPERIPEAIQTLVNMLISPIEGIDVATLRGQLTNLKVNDYSTGTVSYDTKFETNFSARIGFEAYPREVIDIIEGLLGFDTDFNIQIGLKTNAKVEKMPMILTQDPIMDIKHQMIGIINNPASIEDAAERKGLGMMPRLFNIMNETGEAVLQFLEDDTWSMSFGLDLDVKFVSDHFTLDVYALTAKDLKIDADMLIKILGDITNNQSNAKVKKGSILNLIAQIVSGWSTYYFSDVVYASPKDPIKP